MSWVETESLSFTARHEDTDEDSAQRTLDALEDLRLKLEERFEEAPDDVTVVVHPSPAWLNAAHPFLPAPGSPPPPPAAATWPAGRWPRSCTYSTTTTSRTAPRARTPSRPCSGTAERLYAQVVIGANNESLPPPWGPRRFSRYLRWTWMVEGGAQYFSGQVPLFRAAVQTRMRAGETPSFPPGVRDAMILGGTVFDLLERMRGRDACSILISRLRRDGPERAIELAFDGRMREIESEWRAYLRDVVPRAGSPDELDELHW